MNTTPNLNIEGLVRIAESGARAALKLGQDLQPVVIGLSTSGPIINALSGRVFPQPPLVFVAQRSGVGANLRVFALEHNARPKVYTPLFMASYWNASQGTVCLSSTQRPDSLEPDKTTAWSAAFFASAFTHGTSHLVIGTGKSYAEFWCSLERRKTFPIEALIAAKRTLQEVLK